MNKREEEAIKKSYLLDYAHLIEHEDSLYYLNMKYEEFILKIGYNNLMDYVNKNIERIDEIEPDYIPIKCNEKEFIYIDYGFALLTGYEFKQTRTHLFIMGEDVRLFDLKDSSVRDVFDWITDDEKRYKIIDFKIPSQNLAR